MYRFIGTLSVVLLLLLGACSESTAIAPASASVSASEVVPPMTEPAASASETAEASVLPGADCINQELFDLFVDNLESLEALSADQRQDIATALSSYDFGDDDEADSWREDIVTALQSGEGLETVGPETAMLLTMGHIEIQTCP
jgi:hypothetical protein